MSNEGKQFSDKATWSQDDIEIDKLDQRPRADFDCGRKEQNDYFIDWSIKDQEQGLSVTYLLKIKGEQAGFVTITMDEIPLRWRELPKDIRFTRLPATKLAQMGVHKGFAKQGLGQLLVSFAIRKAKELSNEIGCRFVTLDAKTDIVKWYEEQGFMPNNKDNEERQREAEQREKDLAEKEQRPPRPISIPVSMRIDLHSVD
jgi:GNAT superfamily N-acetyltransferase